MTSPAGRLIGIAQLSLLSVPPPQMVQIAAEAGFDFVGLRVRPVTDQEPVYDLQPGSPLLRQTLARMADTDVTVKDIEFLLLDGSDQRDAWMAMFEAGQALGADSLTVACADQDLARAEDTLARMAQDGRAYGITPALEAISYQAVHSLPTAARLARAAACDVLVDTLHVGRFGGTAAELTEIAPLVPLLQLCDAPAAAPTDREGLIQESRSRRLPPGDGELEMISMLRALEAGLERTPREGSRLPLSVEVPHTQRLAERGPLGWAQDLMAAARSLLEAAAVEPLTTPAPARPNGD